MSDFSRITSFLLAGVQPCMFFESNLMDTCKWSKQRKSDFKAMFQIPKHFNCPTLFNVKGGILIKYDFQLKTADNNRF